MGGRKEKTAIFGDEKRKSNLWWLKKKCRSKLAAGGKRKKGKAIKE
jgi:hypothetical protein